MSIIATILVNILQQFYVGDKNKLFFICTLLENYLNFDDLYWIFCQPGIADDLRRSVVPALRGCHDINVARLPVNHLSFIYGHRGKQIRNTAYTFVVDESCDVIDFQFLHVYNFTFNNLVDFAHMNFNNNNVIRIELNRMFLRVPLWDKLSCFTNLKVLIFKHCNFPIIPAYQFNLDVLIFSCISRTYEGPSPLSFLNLINHNCNNLRELTVFRVSYENWDYNDYFSILLTDSIKCFSNLRYVFLDLPQELNSNFMNSLRLFLSRCPKLTTGIFVIYGGSLSDVINLLNTLLSHSFSRLNLKFAKTINSDICLYLDMIKINNVFFSYNSVKHCESCMKIQAY